MHAMAPVSINNDKVFNPSTLLSTRHLIIENLDVKDIPIVFSMCEEKNQFEFAVWLLGHAPKRIIYFVENQLDSIVLHELQRETIPPNEKAEQWALSRMLVLDAKFLIKQTEIEHAIALQHHTDMWAVHPSAKRIGFWQATHYDLETNMITGNTIHAKLSQLFHFSAIGAGIHPGSTLIDNKSASALVSKCI